MVCTMFDLLNMLDVCEFYIELRDMHENYDLVWECLYVSLKLSNMTLIELKKLKDFKY